MARMNGIFESERLLRRREAAEALTEAGFKIAPATLAKLASVGAALRSDDWSCPG